VRWAPREWESKRPTGRQEFPTSQSLLVRAEVRSLCARTRYSRTMGGLVPAPPSFKPIRAYVAQLMGHADATTTLRVYARLMQEGVRLDREETLRALYDAYGWSGATPVLPREEDAGMEDAKTRMNTGGPAWIRTRNQRLMRAFQASAHQSAQSDADCLLRRNPAQNVPFVHSHLSHLSHRWTWHFPSCTTSC